MCGELWGKLCIEGLLQCVHMYSVAWESFVLDRNWVGAVYGSSWGERRGGGLRPRCVHMGRGLCAGELCWGAVWGGALLESCVQGNCCACGTWQFCLHNYEPCGFITFLCVSVATHVTARGVRVIAMKRRIRFGSVRGLAGTEANCFTRKR